MVEKEDFTAEIAEYTEKREKERVHKNVKTAKS